MGTTRAILLREAEKLLRTRGYSAFSYADLAERLNIRKPSIHHHFPTKENLGLTLVDEYLARFSVTLLEIEQTDSNAVAKLRAYAALFSDSTEDCQLPLCCALAAESASLPDSMRKKTSEFFDLHLQWLGRIISLGVAERSLRASLEPKENAFLVLSLLEGASLISWMRKDPSALQRAFEGVLANLCSTH